MNEFWQKIKKGREQSGKTLKDISESTKIDIKYLENIEDGNFSTMDPIYMRLFIKAYAKEININYEELIQNTQIPKKNEERVKRNIIGSKNKTAKNKNLNISKKNNSNKVFQIIAILVIFVFIIAIINQVITNNKKNLQKIKTPTKEQIVKKQSGQKLDINSTDTTITNFNFPIHLELFPNTNLVYRLNIKNNPPRETLILKDNNHSLTIDSSFNIIIYNASQCLLKINDEIVPINPNVKNFEFSISDSGFFSIK